MHVYKILYSYKRINDNIELNNKIVSSGLFFLNI